MASSSRAMLDHLLREGSLGGRIRSRGALVPPDDGETPDLDSRFAIPATSAHGHSAAVKPRPRLALQSPDADAHRPGEPTPLSEKRRTASNLSRASRATSPASSVEMIGGVAVAGLRGKVATLQRQSIVKPYNVLVGIRARPLSDEEVLREEEDAWEYEGGDSVWETTIEGERFKQYLYDFVFPPPSATATVYAALGVPIVESVMKGYHGTVFAYGQTGSGKTHTLMGTEVSPGMTILAIHDIFERIERAIAEEGCEFHVRVSYLEIYNEHIMDLLNPSGGHKLVVANDPVSGPYVKGLTEEVVLSASRVIEILRVGEANRHVASTRLNVASSRSHTLFRMVIETADPPGTAMSPLSTSEKDSADVQEDARTVRDDHGHSMLDHVLRRKPGRGLRGAWGRGRSVRVSSLNMVDLAGSENVKRSGASGQQMKEAGHINTSLVTLGTVISKLVEGADHIPYRDSKLTRLLSASLGGNARTAVVVTMSPSSHSVPETRRSLQFATRAMRVVNKARVNEVSDKAAIVDQLRREIAELRAALVEGRGGMVVTRDGEMVSAEEMLQRMHDYHEAERERLAQEVQGEVHRADAEARSTSELMYLLFAASHAISKLEVAPTIVDTLCAVAEGKVSAAMALAHVLELVPGYHPRWSRMAKHVASGVPPSLVTTGGRASPDTHLSEEAPPKTLLQLAGQSPDGQLRGEGQLQAAAAASSESAEAPYSPAFFSPESFRARISAIQNRRSELEQQVSDLLGQVSDMETALELERGEHDSTRGALEDMQEKLRELERQYESASARSTSLSQEVGAAHETIKKLEAAVRTLQGEKGALERQLEIAERTEDQLEAVNEELKNARAHKEAAEVKGADQLRRAEEAGAAKSMLERELAVIRKQLEKEQSRAREAMSESRQFREAADASRTAAMESEASARASERAASVAEKDRDAARDEAMGLRDALESTRADLHRAEHDRVVLEEEVDRLRDELHGLETRHQDVERELRQESSALSSTQQARDEAVSNSRRLEAELSASSKTKESLENSLNELRSRLVDSETRLGEARSELAELRAKTSASSAENAQMDSSLKEGRRLQEQQRVQISALERRLSEAKRELEDAKRALESAEAEHARVKTRLSDQLEERVQAEREAGEKRLEEALADAHRRAEEAVIMALQQQQEELSNERDDEFSQLRAQWEDERSALKRAHSQALHEAEQQRREALESARSERLAAVETTERSWKQRFQELEMTHKVSEAELEKHWELLLEQRQAALAEASQDAQEREADLRGRVEELRDAQLSLQGEISSLQSQVRDRERGLEQGKRSLQELKDKHRAALEDANRALETVKRDLSHQLSVALEDNKALSVQVETLSTELHDAESRATASERSIESLREQAQSAQRDHDRTKADWSRADGRLRVLEAEHDRLQRELARSAEEAERHRRRVDALEVELEEERAAAQGGVSAAESLVEKTKAALSVASREAQSWRDRAQQAQEQAASLESRTVTAEDRLARAVSRSEEHERSSRALESQVASLRAELERTRSEISTLTESARAAMDDRGKARLELERVTGEGRRLAHEFERLSVECDRLRAEAERARIEAGQSRAEAATARAEAQSQGEAAREAARSAGEAEDSRAAAEARMHQLLIERDEAVERAEEAQYSVRHARDAAERAEGQLSRSVQDASRKEMALNRTVEELQMRVRSLEDDLARAQRAAALEGGEASAAKEAARTAEAEVASLRGELDRTRSSMSQALDQDRRSQSELGNLLRRAERAEAEATVLERERGSLERRALNAERELREERSRREAAESSEQHAKRALREAREDIAGRADSPSGGSTAGHRTLGSRSFTMGRLSPHAQESFTPKSRQGDSVTNDLWRGSSSAFAFDRPAVPRHRVVESGSLLRPPSDMSIRDSLDRLDELDRRSQTTGADLDAIRRGIEGWREQLDEVVSVVSSNAHHNRD
jgi:chromosome segregation ATPase